MPSVRCASSDCKYNGARSACHAKNLSLSDCSVVTLSNGREHFWRCKQYEMSEEARRIKEEFEKMGLGRW